MEKLGRLATGIPTTCLAYVDDDQPLVACALEDGRVQLWDLRVSRSVMDVRVPVDLHVNSGESCCLSSADNDGDNDMDIGAMAFSSSTSELLVAVGGELCALDLKSASWRSIAVQEQEHRQPSPMPSQTPDCINSIAVQRAGTSTSVALARDSGTISVHQRNGDTLAPSLRLSGRAHTNITMDVRFQSRASNEVLSVGLDGRMLLWDCARGRLVDEVDFMRSSLAAMSQAALRHESSAHEPQVQQIGNPPFAHCLDVSADGRVIAVGLGDGSVARLVRDGRGHASRPSRWPCTRLTDGHASFVARV